MEFKSKGIKTKYMIFEENIDELYMKIKYYKFETVHECTPGISGQKPCLQHC